MNELNQDIAVLMMQKNENELLEKWIIYHANVFGLENLYVFDNGSDSTGTKGVLKKWQEQGLNVSWEHNTKQDFEKKGTILGDKIKELDNDTNYSCFMPLDCDEFVGVKLDDGTVSCEPKDILDELHRYSGVEDMLLIETQFFNSPISNSWFNRFENRKCIFIKGTFKSMDVGFHWGKVKNSDKEIKTNIVQFHFHYKPFEDAREHAKNKLALRVESFDREYLLTYKGSGLHLTKYFLLTEAEYLKQVLRAPHYKIGSIQSKFEQLSIQWPYYEKMQRSLHVLQPDIDSADLDKVEGLHNTVDHKFRGSIDQVVVKDKSLVLDGWAAENGTLQISKFLLVGLDGERELEISKSVFRPDIARLLGFKDREFGFSIKISIELLHELNAKNLEVKAISHSGQLSPCLSINIKYVDMLNNIFNP